MQLDSGLYILMVYIAIQIKFLLINWNSIGFFKKAKYKAVYAFIELKGYIQLQAQVE